MGGGFQNLGPDALNVLVCVTAVVQEIETNQEVVMLTHSLLPSMVAPCNVDICEQVLQP